MTSRRGTALSLAALMLLLGCLLSLHAGATIVVTRGVSMQPTIQTGDLVVAFPAGSYQVGDVVAYRSSMLHTTVLHRIVARDGSGWTLKGDNNSWLDPEHPSDSQLLGRQILHVPNLGSALAWAAQTRLWLLIALAGLVTGGTARHVRKVAPVAHHRKKHSLLPLRLSKLAVLGGTAAVLATAAAVIGAQLLTAPPAAAGAPSVAVNDALRRSHSLTFTYSAALRTSAASGDGYAVAPEPVFRTLTDDVMVKISYRGPATPTTVHVTGRLATASGWQDQIPVGNPVKVSGGSWEGQIRLHLPELAARARAASAAIGVPVGDIHVTLTPTISTSSSDAKAFSGALELVLDAAALRLKDPAAALSVSDAPSASARTTTRSADLVASVRAATLPYGVPLALVVGLLGWTVRSHQQRGPAVERYRRQHAKLLLPSQPVTPPRDVTLVEVHELDRLAALAGAWQLPILHWSNGTGDVFMVIAEHTAYRFVVNVDAEPAAARRRRATLICA